MDNTLAFLRKIEERQGVPAGERPKRLTMIDCLVQVVKNNMSFKLLSGIGLKNAKRMWADLQNDPLLNPAAGGAPAGGEAVIIP